MKKIILYLAALLLIIVSCGTPRKSSNTSTQNTSYKRDDNSIRPLFTVFHVSDSISELHFKISSKEILYMRPDGINFYSNVLISYRLLRTYDSKEILDSSSVRLVDINNDNTDKSLLGKIDIRARSQNTYFLRVTVADLNR
ncbi:MAG: hypothetical protein K8R85_00845, partial [Bacteroidetes bacterium]|nr:hypothetical protein [Bacteroidota bacterium]